MKKLLLSLIVVLGAFSASAQTYCTPTYSNACSSGDDIDDVFIGTFADSATGCSTNNYGNYTTDTIEISQTVPTAAYLSSNFSSQYFTIWVDWNNDGDFDDSGEHLWSSSTGTTFSTGTSFNLTVGTNHALGGYRMRIRSKYGSAPGASESCSSITWGEAHDYGFKLLAPPACPAPTNLTSTTTDSSMTISWNSNDSAFVVEYGALGFTPGTGTSVNATDTFVVINNLTSNTSYHAYVTTNCTAAGNGSSTQSGPVFAKTLCAPYSLSFYEGFENDSVGTSASPNAPSCWFYSEESGAAGYGYIANSTWVGANTGDNNYLLYNSWDTLREALVSPYMSDLTDGDKQVEFWATTGSTWSDNYILVGTVSSPTNLSTFSLIDSVYIPTGAAYTEYTVYIDSLAGYNMQDHFIAFVTTDINTYTSAYIDDIDVGLAPQCLPPTAFSVDSVGTDSAYVAWTGSGVTGYFEYGPVGFTYGQGTGTVVSTSSTDAWLTGLDSNTAYDVYVYQMCADSSISPAIGPVSFTTLLCPATNGCNFTIELVDSYGDGWNGGEVELISGGVVIATYGSDFTTGTSYNENYQICGSGSFELVVSSLGLYPSEMGVNVYDGGALVASYSPGSGLTTGTVMASVGCNLPCPSLSNVQISAGKNDADVTFSTNGNTGMFVFEYGPAGFLQGTGSVGAIVDSTTSNTISISGLAKESCYDFYIYSNCGALGVSDTLGPIPFCTQACEVADQCHYILSLYDSYGDGWNGASITVTTNGLDQSYAVQDDSLIVDLYLCAGSIIEIDNTVSGSWDSEISYNLSVSGTQVLSVAQGSYATGYVGSDTANCIPVSCAIPTSVAASSITSSSATVSWTGSASSYVYEYVASGSTTPVVGTSTTNSVQLTGLMASTDYFFNVSQVCSAGDTSVAMHYQFMTDSCAAVNFATPTATVTNVTQVDGTVTFDWSSSSNFTGYSIDFGNGQNTSGSGTTATATYTANGSYTAALTLYNDCDTITQNVTVFMSGISIDEVAVARSITMFPNPTTALVNIQVNLFEAGDVELSVLNALGQVVASHEAFASNELQHTFDLSAMASGTYVVRVSTAQGLMQKTVVVRH